VSKTKIKSTHARQVFDSRGLPTIEVEITLNYNAQGRAIAPTGLSTAIGEAVELRDKGESFSGLGVNCAIESVNNKIADILKGQDASDQSKIDKLLIELDATVDKSHLGSNAMIATSMAVAHASASARKISLWKHLKDIKKSSEEVFLPLPQIQIFGGGVHASKRVDIQSYMVVAIGAETFAQALEWSSNVYQAASLLMKKSGKYLGVADEGGLWPEFETNEAAIELILRAIEISGLRPGQDMAISLDVSASQFGNKDNYNLTRDKKTLSSDELSGKLVDWIERYPIVSIEDPMAEGDKEGLIRFTWAVGKRVQVIGDNFLVTRASRILNAARNGACNAVMIKPNQAGTLTETLAALNAAQKVNFGTIASARSGETEDVSIIHIAVGWGINQLKIGSITRGERTAKWNEGQRIAEDLENGGRLAPRSSFPWSSIA
jgi:enolase